MSGKKYEVSFTLDIELPAQDESEALYQVCKAMQNLTKMKPTVKCREVSTKQKSTNYLVRSTKQS
jgi:hypothetical protein